MGPRWCCRHGSSSGVWSLIATMLNMASGAGVIVDVAIILRDLMGPRWCCRHGSSSGVWSLIATMLNMASGAGVIVDDECRGDFR